MARIPDSDSFHFTNRAWFLRINPIAPGKSLGLVTSTNTPLPRTNDLRLAAAVALLESFQNTT
jgi:hypothetical protein